MVSIKLREWLKSSYANLVNHTFYDSFDIETAVVAVIIFFVHIKKKFHDWLTAKNNPDFMQGFFYRTFSDSTASVIVDLNFCQFFYVLSMTTTKNVYSFLSFFFIFYHTKNTFHRSSENDLTFHFFGAESDSIKVREAINRMVEKGRIGNFSLVSTHYALHQEPGLVLKVRRNFIFFLLLIPFGLFVIGCKLGINILFDCYFEVLGI